MIRANPGFARGYAVLADAYAQTRAYDRALAALSKAAELGDRSLEHRARSGYIHARAGRRTDALAIAAELADRGRENVPGAAGGAASVYVGLGDADRAFAWLERARTLRDPWIAYLKVDPKWDPLRSDPRFQTLLVSAQLPR
jgi:tetratricopeptide (TPR) repeat protein